MPLGSKSSSVAVFLGPSLPRREAEQILAADYYPPARRGDIYRLIPSGVDNIVLIDGAFHSTPSIWPREIIAAIAEGIQVIGASSMGALRAAELHEFGMIGCGAIFEWYRDGLIEGDDEVALWHGPEEAGFCPLSEPLVNIRATLQGAVEAHRITSAQAQQLLDFAKETYYPERSYDHLLASSVVGSFAPTERSAFEYYVRTQAINLKRLDAILALRACASGQPRRSPIPTCVEPDRDQQSWQLDRILLSGFWGSDQEQPGARLLSQIEKDRALLARMWTTLSTRAFLRDWARQNKVVVPEDVLRDAAASWDANRDFAPASAWLRANGLTVRSCRALLKERLLAEWLIAQGAASFGLAHVEPQPSALPVPPIASLNGPAQTDQQPGTDTATRWYINDWARQNGVTCPDDVLRDFAARANEPDDDRKARALVKWMVARGPSYFGLDWSFEYALLQELQINGVAAQLLAKAE